MSALRYLIPFISSSRMTQIDMFSDLDNINLSLFINIVKDLKTIMIINMNYKIQYMKLQRHAITLTLFIDYIK